MKKLIISCFILAQQNIVQGIQIRNKDIVLSEQEGDKDPPLDPHESGVMKHEIRQQDLKKKKSIQDTAKIINAIPGKPDFGVRKLDEAFPEGTPDLPENIIPEIEFQNQPEHLGHMSDVIISEDSNQIKIQTLVASKEPYCNMNDWAIVSWKSFRMNEEKEEIEVYNSDKAVGGEGPKIFLIGHYEVSKCWDIAIQQMSQGQIARVSCPHQLDNGDSIDNMSQSGVNWVKQGQDLVYEINVHKCDMETPGIHWAEQHEKLPHLKCLFIISTGLSSGLALSSNPFDKYHPRHTGVFDVLIGHWTGKESTNIDQQWWWNEEEHTFHSLSHADHDGVLFEGFNKNIIVYKNLNKPRQKFHYDIHTQKFRNEMTNNALSIDFHDEDEIHEHDDDDHEAHPEPTVIAKEGVPDDSSILGINWEAIRCEGEQTVFNEKYDQYVKKLNRIVQHYDEQPEV